MLAPMTQRRSAQVRWAFTALNALYHALVLFCLMHYGFAALPWCIAAELLLVAGDFWVSTASAANLRTLQANGYSTSTVLTTMALNLVPFYVANCVLAMHCAAAERQWGLGLWVRVLLNLALSEVGLTLSHRALHKRQCLAPFHVMHHCCLSPSHSTNFVLHPVDFAMEFYWPAVIVGVSSLVVFSDRWLMLVSLTAVELWYVLDHDENLLLSHARHHLYIDSVYSAYVNFKDDRPQVLRSMVKRAA